MFQAHSGQFLFMMQDYFKKSLDTTSDPVAAFNSTRERVANDNRFVMFACTQFGVPMGFMAADVLGDGARIVSGYISPSVDSMDRSGILVRVMKMFDDWARGKACKASIFYTQRAPGAHRLMLKHGWHYVSSVYKKELI